MKGLYILNRAAVFEAMAKNGIKTLQELEKKIGASHGAMSYALTEGHTTSKRMAIAIAYSLNTNVEAIAKLRTEITKPEKAEDPKEETPTQEAAPQWTIVNQLMLKELKAQTKLLERLVQAWER